MPAHNSTFVETLTPVPAAGYATGTAEISVVEVVAALLGRKRFIAIATLAAAAVSAVVIWSLPESFKAEAVIMPPQQQQSSLSAFASGALGGLAGGGVASQLGLKNPADLYIGILESRTISDGIIRQFHLEDVYHQKLASRLRGSLKAHRQFAAGKNSLITISVEDQDPKRAAAIANAYIDELHKQNERLALTDASQRRLFFEQQLVKEKDALADAEIALKDTQRSTGLLAPAGQAEVLIRSTAQLRAEIAARQVELQAMSLYATDENTQVQLLKREITAMQAQLSQLDTKTQPGSGSDLSAAKMPEATLQYLRKLRDMKYHETLFEMLAKQYEAARIDEAKQAPIIQVVDRATEPDSKSWPPRTLLLAGCIVLASLLSSVYVLVAQAVANRLRIASE